MPAISIVMPVYNTEKYVGKAIQSVLNQTFQDFEFVIIDNGSTDGSGDIIQNYASQDNRIRVIKNEENVFIADARNQAIENLKGEYLYLIDSDDWILPEMLETMYKRGSTFRAQYVVCGYFMDYYENGKAHCYAVCPDDRDMEQSEFRNKAVDYLVHTILTVPWNKLYSLSYIREHAISFRHTKLEDHHFNMDFIMDVERVSMISTPFYHYYRSRQGTDSQVVYNYYLNQKKREHIGHTLDVYRYWGIDDQATMSKLANYHLGRLVECVSQTVSNDLLSKEEKEKEIDLILADKYTRFAVKNRKNLSVKMSALAFPICIENRPLCFVMGRFVTFFKKTFSSAFYKMRAGEAQGANEVAR